MFKIIQTLERGSQKLSIVPAQWELDGELAWPKSRADRLIKISDSKPDDTWFRMPCKLKRNHLINYQIAEEELDRMLEQDDTTDQEEKTIPVGSRKRSKVCRNKFVFNEDFNVLAEVCSVSHIL